MANLGLDVSRIWREEWRQACCEDLGNITMVMNSFLKALPGYCIPANDNAQKRAGEF
jgi:hypothetical protein